MGSKRYLSRLERRAEYFVSPRDEALPRPLPPPGDIPDPGIEPMSLLSLALAGGFFTTIATWEAGCANCQSLPQAELFVRQRERPGLRSPGQEEKGTTEDEMAG